MRRVSTAVVLLAALAAPAAAQSPTDYVARLSASTRVVIGAATFGTTSPLQVVGLPTIISDTVAVLDGSGNIGKNDTYTRRTVNEQVQGLWWFYGGLAGPLDILGALTVSGDVAVNGNDLTTASGDLRLGPAGHVLPSSGYAKNLGALTNKFLALHAAELWVETLVAQNTLATIGGRVLVGPTTTLIADVTTGATTIDVKYNNLANGDRVYLEANGAVEFLAVTSGATSITGGYRYSVTRNVDGSGANAWTAGDAVFNTGQTGSGWIDLYSVRGVKAGTELGPTIVGNVRNSGTYNDWSPRWAIGNLDGLYGYSGTTFGTAFGPASDSHLTIDATNGVRMRDNTTTLAQWATDGTITIGALASNNTGQILLDSSSLAIRWRDNSGSTSSVFTIANSGGTGLITSSIPLQVNAGINVTGNVINPSSSTWVLQATNTAAVMQLQPGAGGYVGINSATDFRPTTDSAIPLGTNSLRWDNINLDLPNNASPAYVVVNKGTGADANSALGYAAGVTGTVVVKGSGGSNCDLVFTVGLLMSETCP